MRTIILIMVLMASVSLVAQENIDSILFSIEENNSTLKALREETNAQKLGNKTGIYLSDPDVEFGYLWGNPGKIGNRQDFSIKQTFDIPTLTGMRSRLAGNQNKLVELQYASERINLLLEAKQYCIYLVYYNGLKKELKVRLRHAQAIADAYRQRLDRGDASILEYNKVQLNLSTVQGEMSRIEVERILPKFSAGYSLERTLGQKYQGISVGISIPLWENKNRVKQAKAGVVAAQAREQDSKQQFYDRLRNLYMRASGLQQTAIAYRESLKALNNTALLMKALDVGEISLLNYIVEIGLYYDTVNQTLAAERDFEKALADLSAVEL